jgi:hypothetical protein
MCNVHICKVKISFFSLGLLTFEKPQNADKDDAHQEE